VNIDFPWTANPSHGFQFNPRDFFFLLQTSGPLRSANQKILEGSTRPSNLPILSPHRSSLKHLAPSTTLTLVILFTLTASYPIHDATCLALASCGNRSSYLQTTLEASQVMVIVEARSVAAPAISTGAEEPYRTGINKQSLPEVKEPSVLEWLQAVDLSGTK